MARKKKKLKQDPAALAQSFSKNLLGLKFMQRAQKVKEQSDHEDFDDDDDDEEDEEEDDDVDNDDRRVEGNDDKEASLRSNKSPHRNSSNKTKRCIMHPSYQFCERLIFGRLSFKGMNIDIEAIMHNNSELDGGSSNLNSRSSPARGKKRVADESWDDL